MTHETQVEEISQKIQDLYFDNGARVDIHTWEETKALITSVSAEAEARLIERVLKLVDEHDPNVGMGRDTSPAYWGNTLRKALQALTNQCG